MLRKLGVAVVALATCAVPASAAAAPPTLTGEQFHQDRPAITWADCRQDIAFGYIATGQATGPYPGRFVETGTAGPTARVHATFTIDSPVGQVSGTKTGQIGRSCVTNFACSGVADCERASIGYNTLPDVFATSDVYRAKIRTAAGVFEDRGLFSGTLFHSPEGNLPFDGFDSAFQSDLQSPVQLLPKSKADCKHGGWRDFGVFRDQGQCVSFVASGGTP